MNSGQNPEPYPASRASASSEPAQPTELPVWPVQPTWPTKPTWQQLRARMLPAWFRRTGHKFATLAYPLPFGARISAGRLPPAGPVWFGSVMGTSMMAMLAGLYELRALAIPMLFLNLVLVTYLCGSFTRQCAKDPGVLLQNISDGAIIPYWGLVAMGLMSTGSSTLIVLPMLSYRLLPAAHAVDIGMWIAGSAIGFISAFGFAGMLMKNNLGRPVPAWGLPLVSPMVTATTSAAMSDGVQGIHMKMFLLTIGVLGFFLAWILGIIVFGVTYEYAWFEKPLPDILATSTFIPLGIIGQSAAAAQVLQSRIGIFMTPDAAEALESIALWYGAILLLTGLPLLLWAMFFSYRAFARKAPFVPGWWAMTFPVGTCSLGALYMGWDVSAALLFALLGAHWLLCAVASVQAIAAQRSRGTTVVDNA